MDKKKMSKMLKIGKPFEFDPETFRVKVKQNYRFKGWCYVEIGEALSIPHLGDCEDYYDTSRTDVDAIRIRRFVNWALECREDNKIREYNVKVIAKVIRSYLRALLKYRRYDDFAYVWDGLLKISWDDNLIKATMPLLELLWN